MSGVQSIERAFVLLRALGAGAAGVTELADRTDLPKSTVARLLGALEAEGAAEQDEIGGVYRLGQSLSDLAGANDGGHNMIAAARIHLWDLTEQSGETSGLSILDRSETLYLEHYESDEEVQVRAWTGERVPLHLVPSGLVLLSGQPDSFIEDYLAGQLEATTQNSVIEPQKIRERLTSVRKDGLVWMYAEFDDSINSVAAPVVGRDDTVIAALHIHGPAYRFPADSETAEIGDQIRLAAGRLSQQLA